MNDDQSHPDAGRPAQDRSHGDDDGPDAQQLLAAARRAIDSVRRQAAGLLDRRPEHVRRDTTAEGARDETDAAGDTGGGEGA